MADPENPLGGGGAIICNRNPPTSSNGMMGRFLIYIVKFTEGHGPLGPTLRSATVASNI